MERIFCEVRESIKKKIRSVYFLNFGRGENVDMNRFHLKMIWIIKKWILYSKVTNSSIHFMDFLYKCNLYAAHKDFLNRQS